MKTEVVGWGDFFQNKSAAGLPAIIIETDQLRNSVIRAITKKENIIKIAGITLMLLVGIPGVTHAAGTGIDVAAEKIYRKLMNVGKWVIVIKGGIDTIQSAVNGDLQASKKNFLGYLFVYIILWALPWGLKQVDVMFADMGV